MKLVGYLLYCICLLALLRGADRLPIETWAQYVTDSSLFAGTMLGALYASERSE